MKNLLSILAVLFGLCLTAAPTAQACGPDKLGVSIGLVAWIFHCWAKT